MADTNQGQAAQPQSGAVDARGTSPQEGVEIVRRLRDNGFGGDDEKLGVALGRPVEEIQSWWSGAETPDDIIMKARGLAQDRNIEI